MFVSRRPGGNFAVSPHGALWHRRRMDGGQTAAALHSRLIGALYVEAMLLADEARGYFDQVGRDDRGTLDPMTRVSFSCESLKVTTRLMHVIAWLLTQRAVEAGEISARESLDPSRQLGEAPVTDPATIIMMPHAAQALIAASIDLHRRVLRLEGSLASPVEPLSPARAMIERLAARL